MTKKEIQISNIVTEIEIAQKKAKVTLDTFLQNYFELTDRLAIHVITIEQRYRAKLH